MRFCKINAVSVPRDNKKEKPKFTVKSSKIETKATKKPRIKQVEKTEEPKE